MSRRLLILLCAAAFVAAACSDIPKGEVVAGEGPRFVVSIADSLDDVGLGNAVTVGPEGEPFFSYLILPAELAPGEIPVGRPIGAPYIQGPATPAQGEQEAQAGEFGAAIGVGSVSADGIFTRGAAAQVRDSPQGVVVPYGPATLESLVGATAQSLNGTDIAVGPDGAKHVVWTAPDGVYHAVGGAASFTVEQVYEHDTTLRRAGPIGRPGVAIGPDGEPWVAYTVNAQGQRVEVAVGSDDGWRTETVARIPQCAGCPQPGRTQIGMTDAGPMVAWIDPAARQVKVATRAEDGTWTARAAASGVRASGLAMAVDAGGRTLLSFYDGDVVRLAAQRGPVTWAVDEIGPADLGDAAGGVGNLAPTTGVAVDEEGVRYIAFMDAGTVILVRSEQGGDAAAIETGGLGAAAFPAVAVTPDASSVYLTWYDEDGQLLKLGIQGDLEELQIANPSPTTEAPAGGGSTDCGADGEILLDIATPAGLVYDTDCLVAPADESFTINYLNDSDVLHNINVLTAQGGESLGLTEPETGPGNQQELPMDPLAEGAYFFQCDVHPTTMLGTLAAVPVGGN